MVETALDAVTISSGSGTERGSFSKDADVGTVGLVVRGDSNSAALDVAVGGVALEENVDIASQNSTSEVTGLDATTDANNDIAFQLSGLEGFERVAIDVTNQHTADTTVTVETK